MFLWISIIISISTLSIQYTKLFLKLVNKGQVVLILCSLEVPELTEDDVPVIEL